MQDELCSEITFLHVQPNDTEKKICKNKDIKYEKRI